MKLENIPYGQSSAKLPVIRSFMSFRSFRSFVSFRLFKSFGSFGFTDSTINNSALKKTMIRG